MAEDRTLHYPGPVGETVEGRPTFPHKATVDLERNKLFIDGIEFPWYITSEGIDIEGLNDIDRVPVLRFGIFAETVEVLPAYSTTTTK